MENLQNAQDFICRNYMTIDLILKNIRFANELIRKKDLLLEELAQIKADKELLGKSLRAFDNYLKHELNEDPTVLVINMDSTGTLVESRRLERYIEAGISSRVEDIKLKFNKKKEKLTDLILTLKYTALEIDSNKINSNNFPPSSLENIYYAGWDLIRQVIPAYTSEIITVNDDHTLHLLADGTIKKVVRLDFDEIYSIGFGLVGSDNGDNDTEKECICEAKKFLLKIICDFYNSLQIVKEEMNYTETTDTTEKETKLYSLTEYESYKKENNYNLIFSNIILAQEKSFTYEDIVSEIKKKMSWSSMDSSMEHVLKECIIRLRDDGFITVLGSTYTVDRLLRSSFYFLLETQLYINPYRRR